ncbi:CheR family methyltransferase [Nocardia crassostreae]|uniref:CheR family methyltransferase n=1 Tax=Nocardia crassostreae TaxID=53428 RepID=UPI000AD08CBF|nr:CheR family methyltransferase [Nocardia crassostreae]
MTNPADPMPLDEPSKPADELVDELEDLLIFIRDSRGFDFTGYKRSSLARRIRKRMQEVRIADYLDYRDFLESNADEFRSLFNTILINVTSFFRDVDAWQYLQREIVPELVTSLDPASEIRIWSASCSSGEEAYSLAIAFAEVLGIEECAKRVKIYGTDVDEEALRDARTGLYTAKALEPLSPELRGRYFEPNGDKFVFRSDLRRRVIFGRHDITRDAPISRLDLLICRNTLMYFNVEAQSQILDRFHFALRQGGFLFLGKAEMLLSDGERFEVANMRQRVFRRRAGEAVALHQGNAPRLDVGLGQEVQGFVKKRQLSDLALETAPFAMIGVDSDGKVTVANNQMRNVFGLNAHDIGRPLSDLEISYRPVELRSVIEQALGERRTIRLSAVERRQGPDEIQYFDVQIQPLWTVDNMAVGVMVSFVDTTVTTRLSQELKVKREELETAYEELQSTNEELETTNEELQSGNEELETMNEELRIRSNELDEARTFLESILSSIAAGVVVLDDDLRVRSWNRGAEELWGLRSDEVNRQFFFALDFGLPTDDLRDAIAQCLKTGRRSGPVDIPAVNRIGRSIVCAVVCSPLDGLREGVVLLMEETAPSMPVTQGN